MGHGFLSFTAKEYHQMVKWQVANTPGLEKYNILLLVQTFRL